MGEEIKHSHFHQEDFNRYKSQLIQETDVLAKIFQSEGFVKSSPVSGFEVEAWLLDQDFHPAPINDAFLSAFNNPLASPELASFNIEVNTEPRQITGHVFSAMHQSLNDTWERCRKTAEELDAKVIMCGILPTVQNEDLNLANMSQMKRYRALNREVFHRRKGKPMTLDINGQEHLRVTHRDVMLESAATSFQIHIQVNQDQAVRFYNASILLSAPLVALTANSPYLFGKDLWDETRIPLFEQAVAIGGYDGAAFGPITRVTFGSGYARTSLMECFKENLEHYPILLPVELDASANNLPHLRLHNGTIWRWNRPLIGFDEQGKPHLRIEQRVVPAGPSSLDAIANAAFFYGAVMALANAEQVPEQLVDFTTAKYNFYRAAQLGLRAQLTWTDGKPHTALDLLRDVLLPLAYEGLQMLDIAGSDIKEYLGVIEERLHSKTNGAVWQRAFVKKHGRDMYALTESYYTQQNSGNPVHEWQV
jgi:gamma-glutamyl:cysteine ligase YbdK (ATP-grasp superfamily)